MVKALKEKKDKSDDHPVSNLLIWVSVGKLPIRLWKVMIDYRRIGKLPIDAQMSKLPISQIYKI